MLTSDDLILLALRRQSVTWPAGASAEVETAVLEAAAFHGVIPLLATAPGIASWPDGVRSTLNKSLRAETAGEVIVREELRRVIAALAEAGVQPLVFKGAQIAYTHYPRPWLRPRLDTDLLIRQDERRQADEALRGLGYCPGTDFSGELVTHQFQYERQDRYGLTHIVDLHWKVANPHVFSDALHFDELDAEAIPMPVLGRAARGLSGRHALLLACLHRVAHHYNSDRLIWFYDIHLLATAMSADGREDVADLARETRLESVCASGITAALARFAPDIPQGWVERLRTSGQDPGPTAVFLQDRRTKLHILLSDLRALPGWRAKLRLIEQHLFPPVAYMRRAYAVSNPSLLPFAYVHRIVSGVRNWVRRH